MKINLIFFLSDFSLGGAGNSIIRLCEYLSKKSIYNIVVISIGQNPYKSKFNQKIKYIELEKKKLIYSIFNLNYIIKKNLDIKKKNILVSNIHYNNVACILMLKKIKFLKIILVERTPIEELDIFFTLSSYLKNKLLKFLVRYLYKFADRIVVNSNGIKKGLKKLVTRKIDVIYPPSIKNVNKKDKYNSNNNIVTISRLSKEKKIDLIIKAFEQIKFNYKFFIYGTGPEKEKLNKLIKNKKLQKKIFLMGHTSDPNNVLKKSKIFILNSIFEGCSNALIEALNNNNIVLCSKSPGGNSEIILNGKGGNFFKTNDYNDLSEKILMVMKNQKKFFKKTLFAKKFLNRFTYYNNFYKYDKLFKKI